MRDRGFPPIVSSSLFTSFSLRQAKPQQNTIMELSPKSMAQAAYEDAVANMSNGQYGGSEGDHGHGGGGNVEKINRGGESAESVKQREETLLFNTSQTNNVVNMQHDEKAMSSHIEDIWRSSSGSVDKKITQTMETILTEIDGLVGLGLGAFSALDTTRRQLGQSKELAENRDREAKRLHAIDEQSRSTLSVSGSRRRSIHPLKIVCIAKYS